MKVHKMKTMLLLSAVLLLSIVLGVANQIKQQNGPSLNMHHSSYNTGVSILDQKVLHRLSEPVRTTQIYYRNQRIGSIADEKYLTARLDQLYQEAYAEHFPNSELYYSEDVYTVTTETYNHYEDIDHEIFEYLERNDLLSIKAQRIEFSNGAIIYCRSLEDFETARQKFIAGYVSQATLEQISGKESIPNLTEYGTQYIGFEVVESLIYSEGFASLSNIMVDEREIFNFLSFGYDFDAKSYTVQEFDTIAGIAWLNQMSSQQLLSINSEQIISENQVLKPGTELEVTRINSPLTVRVTQQRLVSETIFPESTLYIEDPTLREGMTRVKQKGRLGSEDVLYVDVIENDIAVDSRRIHAATVVSPIQEVVYVGTYVEPRVGTGVFRMPMNNSRISCGWGCYAGHQGIDVQSRANRGYGPVLAADRGVVEVNGYQRNGYGYYVIINHNNGFKTLYAHLDAPGYFKVGQTVRQGEQIGYVGMTGRTTGPHLHFEIIVNGSRRNPCGYLSC